MALIYIDGFDWVVDGVIAWGGAGRWSHTAGLGFGYNRLTNTPSGTGAAGQLIAAAANAVKTLPSNYATFFTGFHVFFDLLPTGGGSPFFVLTDGGSNQCLLRLNANGKFQFECPGGNTEGTFVMSSQTWVHLEAKITINNSTGSFELRINGSSTPDISVSSTDTQTTANATVDGVKFANVASENPAIDNFFFADDTGGQGFLGEVWVETLVADGAGASAQFTPSAGSNWQNVDELPTDNDTTYNESSTVGHKDRHTHTNLPANSDTILGVQVGVWARETEPGDRDIRLVAYDGTTEGDGGVTHAVGADWSWYCTLFEDHPTGAAAWTESEVNSGQFGYKVQA